MVATTSATTPPPRPGRAEDQFLPLPQNVYQARALALLGLNWLTAHAPEQLKTNIGPSVVEALELADRMCKEAHPKFNWGASCLDSNAVDLLNRAPSAIEKALALVRAK